jgi:tetrapyrrole methylase family protein / MazG family protein
MTGERYPEFARLVEIMERLRGPGGCPWDRAQSREDLKPYLVEETYEVLDAIEQKDLSMLREELGDLLLQVVFHAQLAAEDGHFTVEDVCRAINEKLVRRHPHVFGEVIADTPAQVLLNWEAIKKVEKGEDASVLSGVPKVLPALLKAYRLQQKAARVGFDWEERKQVEDKVKEEWAEVNEAVASGDKEHVREELGDFLFALVNLSRFLEVDPEDALQLANLKFMRRFKGIETEARSQGKDLHGMTLGEMDALWELMKQREREGSPELPFGSEGTGERESGRTGVEGAEVDQ